VGGAFGPRPRHAPAERLHEALLKERTEDLAVLLVEAAHPKVRALYES
jgi:hypothetical protein